ncbi:MAG TPA: 6-phosphofructokinase [Methanospirillum sp.]|uniref:6-phosphofructokinase n=1 Tax=Methanospirillum sp. TaxID=45200 RepID=UPI002B73790F|nr:6-phosphofructokinase [Methanospirillum sp.]HWQ63838.1 6-phosphofructokinase [Methanospirillum sp.]
MGVKMQRIAVVTSGGDAPGMNACIRAVYRAGVYAGVEIYGIRRGYTGMIDGDIYKIQRHDVGNIIHQGGTILGTSRSDEFRTPEGRQKAADQLFEKGIDGLILIGGDGSFKGGNYLSEETGIPIIAIPGTIDNDIAGTDFSIGFDTAVNIALESIDRIRDTAISHGRLFFVEVMGHTSSFIALEAGIAGGAAYLVLHDGHQEVEELCLHLESLFTKGKHHAIVVVAEGDHPGCSFGISKQVSARIKMESRVCVLGHTQRGGSPTSRDRVLAAKLGVSAVNALLNGQGGVMVGEIKREVVFQPFSDVIGKQQTTDPRMAVLSRILTGF